jgi:predicted lipoprotein with Yx(FWY)xxD motif
MGVATSGAWRKRGAGLAILAVVALGSSVAASAFAVGGSNDQAAAGALVKQRTTGLGRVLVDRSGRTLYLFEADEFGRSACYGRCAKAWPPLLTTGEPRAGSGVQQPLLGTTKRKDGRLQVTYQGYPLYLFVRDAKAGQTLGQGLDGFGGEWYVLDRQGRKIEHGRHGGDAAVVEARKTALGRVLVDDRGRTLYLFEADQGRQSVCYGKCAAAWPPLLTSGKPHAGAGARAGLLGTTRRTGGQLQVTYGGHPLYYFVRDEQAGATAGQGLDGFGGEWYVLDRSGRKLEKQKKSSRPGTTTTTTTTTTDDDGSGGGYGGGG